MGRPLGWTLDRTRDAIDQLDQHAPTCGLRVHQLQGMASLVRDDTAADPDQIQQALRRQHARDGMNTTEARTLYKILNGADHRNLQGNATQVALGRLRNAGYITRDDTPELAGDVLYSLVK